jgi:hypothetical protein
VLFGSCRLRSRDGREKPRLSAFVHFVRHNFRHKGRSLAERVPRGHDEVVSMTRAARTAGAGSLRGPAPRSARVATSPCAPAPGRIPSSSHTSRECGPCGQAASRAGAGARRATA